MGKERRAKRTLQNCRGDAEKEKKIEKKKYKRIKKK